MMLFKSILFFSLAISMASASRQQQETPGQGGDGDATTAFLVQVSKEGELTSLIDDLKQANPNAKIDEEHSDPFGFTVSGVTDDAIMMFANSCTNLVLNVFKLFLEGGADGGDDGGSGSGPAFLNKAAISSATCIPKPPSGTVIFTVVYDSYPYETRISIWEQKGVDWTSLIEYEPPYAANSELEITREFKDGKYSFDIVDLWHNGMNSYPDDQGQGWYIKGSVKMRDADTLKVLYEGADFGSLLSVEFLVKEKVVTIDNVKKLERPPGY